jgi:hypothetical protein
MFMQRATVSIKETPPAANEMSLSPLHNRGAGLLQRKCACGGTPGPTGECEACKKKKRLSLQTKLAINQPGDAYEQEADRVAQAMMGSFSHPAEPNSEFGSELQRPPETDLTRGGQRLPSNVAEFFETRFGRDFSAVRVHTGETAMLYNDAVNAYAFTYGSHIWLGPGLLPQPSHILAHELAHVVQQTQPAPLHSATNQPGLSPSRQSVQRFAAPYWLPARFVVKDKEAKGKVGTGTHQLVLPEIGSFNEIFTEAPVPNADRKSADDDKVGIADLCRSDNDSGVPTTVGVYFHSKGIPKELKSNPQLNYAGRPYAHKLHSRPIAIEKRHSVVGALSAPTEITVGDLKPPHDTPDAAEGVEQVQNYLKGFHWAREKVNEMSVGEGGLEQTDHQWPPLKTGIIELRVPSKFQEPAASGQKSEPLVLNYKGQVYHPPDPRLQPTGKVYVRHSARGIWNYRWKPDKPVTAAELETYVHTRGMDVKKLLIDPLFVSQLQMKARPARRPSELTKSPRRIQAREREIAPEEAKDPFDKAALDTWEHNHRRLSGEEKELEKTPEFKKAEFESLVIQERQAAIESGFHFPPIPKAEKEATKGLKQIQFWTNPITIIFGKLRHWFGWLFVKVANAYHAVRAKFHELLHRKNASESGSSLASTIIKIGFQVLKIIARVMIDRTAGYLIQSLKTGVGKKLRSLIPEEGIEEFEAKVEEIKAKAADLEQRAKETIEGWVTSIIGPYEGYINTIEEVANTLNDIKKVVETVKWGARAVACLSPPGWGCLWILAQSVLERFASWLIDRCWFKKHITPLVMKINFVASLPKELAGFIIKKIKAVLPESLSEVIADPAEVDKDKDVKKDIPPNEICGEDDRSLRPPFEVEKEALAELRQEIGEDKWEAWTKLAKLYGRINYGAPLTEAQIAELKKELKKASLPALKEAAELHGAFTPSKEVINLTAFLEEAERVKQQMYGAGGAGAGEGAGEVGISVGPSKKPVMETGRPSRHKWDVVRGLSRGQFRGDVIKIDLAASINGVLVTLENVEVAITNRVVLPSKIVFDLKVTKEQTHDFSEKYDSGTLKKIGFAWHRYRAGDKLAPYTLQLKGGEAE